MSLIRNGGFEQGNTDFWTAEGDGILEISTLLPKYGTYCGKYTSGAGATQYIINNDYIEVNPFDLISLFGWAKTPLANHVWICLFTYDEDYSYIGVLNGMNRAMTGGYININTQIPIIEGIKYVRAGYRVQTALDEIYYLDGFTCSRIEADRVLIGNVQLAALNNATGTNNTADDKKDVQMYNTFEADLIVTYVMGTDPTLDVTVYEMNGNFAKQLVGTFTRSTGVSQERITLSHCTGKELYIEYVVGGTNTPRFTGKVFVIGKR